MGIGIEVTTFTSEGASESVNATMNGRARRRFKIQLTRSDEATYSYVGVIIAFLVPSDQPNIKNIQYRIRYNGQEELLEHIPDSPGTSRVVRLSDLDSNTDNDTDTHWKILMILETSHCT